MGSFPESYNDQKSSKSWMSKQATDAGADRGFFLGAGAPLRNGITDW